MDPWAHGRDPGQDRSLGPGPRSRVPCAYGPIDPSTKYQVRKGWVNSEGGHHSFRADIEKDTTWVTVPVPVSAPVTPDHSDCSFTVDR
jgi:hypothetical protein